MAEYYGEYKQCFEGAGTNPGEKTLEDKFFEYEVTLNVNAFMQQFHYGVFYSFLKLKEQVSTNLIRFVFYLYFKSGYNLTIGGDC